LTEFQNFQNFVVVALERSTGILPVFAYHFTGETPMVLSLDCEKRFLLASHAEPGFSEIGCREQTYDFS
jgi:hypothetical protein